MFHPIDAEGKLPHFWLGENLDDPSRLTVAVNKYLSFKE